MVRTLDVEPPARLAPSSVPGRHAGANAWTAFGEGPDVAPRRPARTVGDPVRLQFARLAGGIALHPDLTVGGATLRVLIAPRLAGDGPSHVR